MVQQPAEARSLGGVEAPQLSLDAVHEPFMFVLKTKILQDFDRRCLISKLIRGLQFAQIYCKSSEGQLPNLLDTCKFASRGFSVLKVSNQLQLLGT